MAKKKDLRQQKILAYLAGNPEVSSSQIKEGANIPDSLVTVKRQLTQLVEAGQLLRRGGSRHVTYTINPAGRLYVPIDPAVYFQTEIDKREILNQYNHDIIDAISDGVSLFSDNELAHLQKLQDRFSNNINEMSETLRNNSFETLAIDLSWKSSEIEGNTYTLLETEALIKESKQADGKKLEESLMILNHKRTIDYIMEAPEDILPLTRAKLEDMHRKLTEGLDINHSLRARGVAIGGTNYRPLDNQFQVEEAVTNACNIINKQESVFAQGLLALLLLSYIQPFEDGNKRTARLTSNAILLAKKHCPLSFRTVDSQDYKKAMLIFYEQNSVIPFKELFIDQYEFAVNTYFA